MAPSVLHFGKDDCHRLSILRSAGYRIEQCSSMPQLASALCTAQVDAVFVTEGEPRSLDQVIPLVRAHSGVAIILFQTTNRRILEKQFDLVVHSLMTPEEWLESVRVVLERKRHLRAPQAVPVSYDKIQPHAESIPGPMRHERS